MQNELTGKVAIITGGLGILGRAFSQNLLARGAKVHVIDVLPKAAARRRLKELGSPEFLSYHRADIRKERQLRSVLDAVLKRDRHVDALICNAALNPKVERPTPAGGHAFERTDERQWRADLDVNLTGAMLCCKVFGSAMKRGGSVVLVSSIYGVVGPDQRIYGRGFTKPASYSASKGALIGLSKYLASYWGPRGLRTNCIVFGGVENGQPQDFILKYSSRVPMQRMGTAEECVGIVRYLVSDESSYANDGVFIIDGGYTAW